MTPILPNAALCLVLITIFSVVKTGYSNNLIGACIEGNRHLIYDLIDLGHDPNHPEVESGWTPLIFAASEGDEHLVEVLILAGADVNKGCKDNWTPVMFALHGEHYDVARLLFSEGADPNVMSKQGMTPMKIAGGKGEHFVELVQEAQRSHNVKHMYSAKKDDTDTLLLEAAHKGDIETIRELIEKGHNVNAKSRGGWNALILASSASNHEIMKLLINAKANVNDKDSDGWTAIMFACHMGDQEGVELLANAGADPFMKSSDGKSAISVASSEGFPDLAQKLITAGMCNALKVNDHARVSSAIDGGADINTQCTTLNGYTPLISATKYRNIRLMYQLLDRGANVNLAEHDGWTPLLFATMLYNVDAVQLLLNYNADANARTKNGLTIMDGITKAPIDDKIAHTQEKKDQIIKMLKEGPSSIPPQYDEVELKEIFSPTIINTMRKEKSANIAAAQAQVQKEREPTATNLKPAANSKTEGKEKSVFSSLFKLFG